MNTPMTAISIILDRSASMTYRQIETVNAVNRFLKKARADDNLKDADLNLTIFDSVSIDTIRSGKPTDIADFSVRDFEPRAATPLYDAVGSGVDDLDRRATDGKGALVIVTDGYENASRKHSHESIKALLDDRQSKGWLVVFLGAGLGAAQQGREIGIPYDKVANIGLDQESLDATMDRVRDKIAGYAATPSKDAAAKYSAEMRFRDDERRAMGDALVGAGLVHDIAPKPNRSSSSAAANSRDAWGPLARANPRAKQKLPAPGH